MKKRLELESKLRLVNEHIEQVKELDLFLREEKYKLQEQIVEALAEESLDKEFKHNLQLKLDLE